MAACCTHRAVGRLTSGIGSTAPVLIARLCAWFSSSASGGGCLRGGHDLTSSRAAFGWLDSARGATADAAGAAPYLLEPSVVSTSSRPASTTTSGAAPAESFAAAAARSAALEDQITTDPSRFRVLTGDRPTGALHLGHYFGTLANRVRLQHAGVEILLVIADYQVITDRDSVGNLSGAVLELVADYLAAGIDPATATIFAEAPPDALTDVTAARIGPAHGAHTNPSAAPTPTPDQKPSPRVLGPNRARRESGACTRAATSGMSSTTPNPIRTTTASVRAAPLANPTPLTSWASATIAIVNVAPRPSTMPSGRRRPPTALADRSAGRTGRTHGVIAVPAPATKANTISRSIGPDDAGRSLRSD